MPDVTGFTLGEAISILKTAGVAEIEIKLTVPPKTKDAEYNEQSRVVRQRTVNDGRVEELIVCNCE